MRSEDLSRHQVNGLKTMITKTEVEWLTKNFPNLSVNEKGGLIEGVARFNSVYDKTANKFTAFLKLDAVYPGLQLSGEYRIKIGKNNKERKIPKLWVYIEREKMTSRRHFFDDSEGHACLTGPVEEDDFFTRGYSFWEYFERFVIPFLYAQSYFDENHKWPWSAYDHNAAGILQSFNNSNGTKSQVLACAKQLGTSKQWSEIEPILRGRFDGKKCLCGSGRNLNKCHPDLVWVIRKFQKALEETGISLRPHA